MQLEAIGLASSLSFRHCEEQSNEAIHFSFAQRHGLLRFARNDGL
jgi:hypothetical protein